MGQSSRRWRFGIVQEHLEVFVTVKEMSETNKVRDLPVAIKMRLVPLSTTPLFVRGIMTIPPLPYVTVCSIPTNGPAVGLDDSGLKENSVSASRRNQAQSGALTRN